MVQDRESQFTRMESELLEAQLNRAEVPCPVEMVMCSLEEEILEVKVSGTPAPMSMNLKCTTGSSQRRKYVKCTKHGVLKNFIHTESFLTMSLIL